MKTIIFDRNLYILNGIVNCKHSTTTNLLTFFDAIINEVDVGRSVDLLYLDFIKAFDKAPHGRLAGKLKAHGIDGPLLRWITNWPKDCNFVSSVPGSMGAHLSGQR